MNGFGATIDRVAHWDVLPPTGLTPGRVDESVDAVRAKGYRHVVFRSPGGRDGGPIMMNADANVMDPDDVRAFQTRLVHHKVADPSLRFTMYVGASPPNPSAFWKFWERWGHLRDYVDFAFDWANSPQMAAHFWPKVWPVLKLMLVDKGHPVGVEPMPGRTWYYNDFEDHPDLWHVASYKTFFENPAWRQPSELAGRVWWINYSSWLRDRGWDGSYKDWMVYTLNRTRDCILTNVTRTYVPHCNDIPRITTGRK